MAAKKHFQILFLLLLSFILFAFVLLFPNYQNRCDPSVCFNLFLGGMQHSSLWDGLLQWIYFKVRALKKVSVIRDTSICEWTCTVLSNVGFFYYFNKFPCLLVWSFWCSGEMIVWMQHKLAYQISSLLSLTNYVNLFKLTMHLASLCIHFSCIW